MQRPLVQFDLAGTPAGTSITRATLWLYSGTPNQVKDRTGIYGAYAAQLVFAGAHGFAGH